MCWDAGIDLPADRHAPARARDFTDAQLTGVLDSGQRTELTDDSCLVISELVTNALNAGATSIHLGLHLHHGSLGIDVYDDAAGRPAIRATTSDSLGGRGLPIVEALSMRWGVEAAPAAAQKRVWAFLAVPGQLTESLVCTGGP